MGNRLVLGHAELGVFALPTLSSNQPRNRKSFYFSQLQFMARWHLVCSNTGVEVRIMSSKAKLFPLSSTGQFSCGMPTQEAWGEPPADSQDAKFLRSWLVYDSVTEGDTGTNRSARSIALGLLVAFAISASFWTGIGLIVTRVWK